MRASRRNSAGAERAGQSQPGPHRRERRQDRVEHVVAHPLPVRELGVPRVGVGRPRTSPPTPPSSSTSRDSTACRPSGNTCASTAGACRHRSPCSSSSQRRAARATPPPAGRTSCTGRRGTRARPAPPTPPRRPARRSPRTPAPASPRRPACWPRPARCARRRSRPRPRPSMTSMLRFHTGRSWVSACVRTDVDVLDGRYRLGPRLGRGGDGRRVRGLATSGSSARSRSSATGRPRTASGSAGSWRRPSCSPGCRIQDCSRCSTWVSTVNARSWCCSLATGGTLRDRLDTRPAAAGPGGGDRRRRSRTYWPTCTPRDRAP